MAGFHSTTPGIVVGLVEETEEETGVGRVVNGGEMRYVLVGHVPLSVTDQSVSRAAATMAALIGEGGHDVYAMYAASRSVSLPLVVFTCMLLRSRHGIAAMALTMTLVQGFDAGIGFLTHEPSKTYGPLILALTTFASLAAQLRSPGVQRDA
jgi:hypothetical protein